MLDEGYAAVSTRRIAAKAGTDKALVHYYFGTMDDLFIAIFRRSAERGAVRIGEALASRAAAVGVVGRDARPVEHRTDDRVHRVGESP